MSEPKKPRTLNSALDPAQYVQHVPQDLTERAEWRGISAIPVYARWLRVDLSNHEALFQESGHHDTWDHVEVSFVLGLIPMYQKFTGNVYGDCNEMALRGHDVGPMVPHVSLPPTNLLMGLHLLSSSCKWPITAKRRLHRGESLCAYAWALAPYLYCSEKKKKKDEKQPQEGKPGAEGGSKSPGSKPETSGDGLLWTVATSGYGICMIPTGGKTVWMRLSLMDLILGWLDVVIMKAMSKVFDNVWTGATRLVKPATKAMGRKVVADDAGRYIVEQLLKKARKDAVKGIVFKRELSAPFKLASFSDATGELEVWTYAFGDWHAEPKGPLRPVELLPEDTPSKDPEPEPQEWLGPYHPDRDRTLLDEFLEGAPHAW